MAGHAPAPEPSAAQAGRRVCGTTSAIRRRSVTAEAIVAAPARVPLSVQVLLDRTVSTIGSTRARAAVLPALAQRDDLIVELAAG